MKNDSSDLRVLRARHVFTGGSEDTIQNGYVAIRGDQVVAVGAWSAPNTEDVLSALGGGAPHDITDYGDCTILPGLIDTHCHVTLAGDRRSYEDMVAEGDEMMALVAVQQLRLHLEAGVTTIRDNGGKDRIPFLVREATRRGYFVAPRMLVSGRPVTHSGGHFHWCNGTADSHDEIRKAVRMLVADGADHIKIMASGGGTGGNIPYLASYDTAEMRVAVETAHALERLTTAHARAASSMVNAIDAGLDCLEHGEFLVRSTMNNYGDDGIAPSAFMQYDASITEKMLTSGTFLSFTMQAGGYDTLLDLREGEEMRGLSGREARQKGELERFFDMKSEVLQRLLSDGALGSISISTDAGPFDASFGNIVYGMELSAAAGMSVADVLRACTSVAARICGVDTSVGTLEPGKLADIVVVGGDVTVDVSRMREVRDVFLNGHCVRRTGQPPTDAARSLETVGQC